MILKIKRGDGVDKKSIIRIIVGALVGVISIVIAILTGHKVKRKKQLKDHPTKYKPL